LEPFTGITSGGGRNGFLVFEENVGWVKVRDNPFPSCCPVPKLRETERDITLSASACSFLDLIGSGFDWKSGLMG